MVDEKTKEIITSFYSFLDEGLGKAEALAEAKRKFRKEHPTASLFYWAAFVLIGDNEPIRLQKRTNYLFPIEGALVLVLAGMVYLRKRRIKIAD